MHQMLAKVGLCRRDAAKYCDQEAESRRYQCRWARGSRGHSIHIADNADQDQQDAANY
jgi:hypothetical protein